MVALVELTAAVVVAAWFIWIGVQAESAAAADRSTLDRVAPFLLGAAGAVGLGSLALRSWRTAERARGSAPSPPRRPTAPMPTSDPPPRASPPPAALSAEGQQELARVVAALAAAGVLAPNTPDPAQLREAAADYGEPVTAESVLRAMNEADWYHPGFAASAYSANLAFHASHSEQLGHVLQTQVADLVRLAGEGLADVTAVVELDRPEGGQVSTVIRLAVGAEELSLVYAGAIKYLSTVLHVALAQILRDRGTGRRLAWLWGDQGVWLSGLADGGVERLNTVLPGPATEGWAWVDEQPPHAAGEMHPGPDR